MDYLGALLFTVILYCSFISLTLSEGVGQGGSLIDGVQRFLDARKPYHTNALKYVEEEDVNIKVLLDRLKRVKRHEFIVIDTGAKASSTTSTTASTPPQTPPEKTTKLAATTAAPTTAAPTTKTPKKDNGNHWGWYRRPIKIKLPKFPIFKNPFSFK